MALWPILLGPPFYCIGKFEVKEVIVHASLTWPIQRPVLIAANKYDPYLYHMPLGLLINLM